ncbi:MAG: hypothetical protein HYZ71_17205 [Deltaproteobacteria bacterium]|nr:hypothetical protein [Deltaproteobacteria bacterium]
MGRGYGPLLDRDLLDATHLWKSHIAGVWDELKLNIGNPTRKLGLKKLYRFPTEYLSAGWIETNESVEGSPNFCLCRIVFRP